MKIFFFILSIMYLSLCLKAQKPALKVDSYEHWPEVGRPGISNDGNFAFYKIENQPFHSSTNVIMSTKTGWMIQFGALNNPSFSCDSKTFYCELENDTLQVLDLISHSITKIPNVSDYRLFVKDNKEWLVLKKDGLNKELIIKSSDKRNILKYYFVEKYWLSPNGKKILLSCLNKDSGQTITELHLIDLDSNSDKIIYKGFSIHDPIFDKEGKQVAFFVNYGNRETIWFCHVDFGQAGEISFEINSNNNFYFIVNSKWNFSHDGKKLFFSLQDHVTAKPSSNKNLTIWNYQEPYLSSRFTRPLRSLAVYNIDNKKTTQLTYSYEDIIDLPSTASDKFIVIKKTTKEARDSSSNMPYQLKSYYACFTDDGKRYPVAIDCREELANLTVSPSGDYIAYYDPNRNGYYCYSSVDRKVRLLLSNTNNQLTMVDKRRFPKTFTVGICGWFSDESGLLIGGSHDLWKVDPQGEKPINITKDIYPKRNIVYFLPIEKHIINCSNKDSLILSAFDLDNKKYSLIKWIPEMPVSEMKFRFEPVYMGSLRDVYAEFTDYDFVKAKNESAYVVRRESTTEAPNYFFTKDFKTFKQLSNINPQSLYNWMTAELHKYPDVTGKIIESVLYKPEDFDPNKRYPIIFNYYETKSNELNIYESPCEIGGDIHRAWLVSNGYLVVKANMEGEPGKIAEGTLMSINAATDYFSKFKWVDSTKMGIAGHSFGGFETNYIISNTTRFAAAVSAAGVSNSISFYNESEGNSSFTRNLAMTLVKSLTEDPLLYLKYSPIVFAGKINTPLLLMHNPNDWNVDYRQSLSFFYELRRFRKPVWMLSYEGEGHGLGRRENCLDYYTRLSEFLNYFLKGAQMPNWMDKPKMRDQ